MRYTCGTDRRRALVAAHPTLNGIDYVEVVDDPAQPDEERQRTLLVTFLKPLAAPLVAEAVRVEGGERIRGVRVTAVESDGDLAQVTVDRRGDFSEYVLRLAGDTDDPTSTEPPEGFDPVLSSVAFSFKAECPTPFDCAPRLPAETDEGPPVGDYLARDYASLRSLLLDRMATLLPDWTERHPADVATALVELVAYVGDRLSYAQDSVATEAYLGTARHRVSVRRHARLVDYRMHDGCNARAWVRLVAAADMVPPAGAPWNAVEAGTAFLTAVPGAPPVVVAGSQAARDAYASGPVVFEAAHPLRSLVVAHNEVAFYTWSGDACTLPRGATTATLAGALDGLVAGDVLVLAALPRPDESVTALRHPVRLTSVRVATDALTGADVTEVAWDDADALPFDLVVTHAHDVPAAVAWGNVVLADAGVTVGPEPLGTSLSLVPVTQAAPLDLAGPAADAYRQDPRDALPALTLTDGDGTVWSPRHDLLGSDAAAPDLVIEVDDEGRALPRFGDGTYGRRPPEGATFTARYRTGNGRAGNVGEGTLVHAVLPADVAAAVSSVTNPLPAAGGTDPETIAEVRRSAPVAMRTQRRAVTPEDYAASARAFPGVQQAVATFRWTGSWHTVYVTVDRLGGRPVDDAFASALRAYLEPVRMAGHDLQVEPPVYVPLKVGLHVCVLAGHRAADVRAAVRDVLAVAFDPDRLTLGRTVWLSPIEAAVRSVPGVASLRVTAFRRWGATDTEALRARKLALGPLEVARLDDDPDFPDRGVLTLDVEGGS